MTNQGIKWTNHFIELFIVIIGITIAFWLNNLASQRRDNNLEEQFITGLKEDLVNDSLALKRAIDYNQEKAIHLFAGLKLIQNDKQRRYRDSLKQSIDLIGNLEFFTNESFILTSLLQSGDIKLISSSQLKKELLRLLKCYETIQQNQENLLSALDENYFPMLLKHVDIVENYRPLEADFYYSLEIKNYCAYTVHDTNNLIQYYHAAMRQIKKVIGIMERGH